MRAPTVRVELTEEQKRLVPDWEERVARFQRRCNKRAEDKGQRFRLVLHEGSHAVQFRQFGWDVKFHGPYVNYEDGELHFVAGGVSPIPTNTYFPLHWQRAMVSIAGFKWVEHFTAVPDEPFVIQTDLDGFRSDLNENEDLNEAVWNAELMLEDQLSQPTFLPELERACRDYEMSVYGTDEATMWGWREYRPEISGKRHRVVVTTTGYFGTLIDGDGLALLTEGELFRVGDELHGTTLEVGITEPQQEEQICAVEKWNRAVSCEARVFGPGAFATREAA